MTAGMRGEKAASQPSGFFETLVRAGSLGELSGPPQRVAGGFMHKMYCLQTTSGKYAVKLMNPAIMRRPDALGNLQRAERLERMLNQNGIPIVPAMELSGQKMHCVDNQHYYLFPWVEGKALRQEEITEEHCAIIGAILARIHKIERVDKPFAKEDSVVDWDGYIAIAVRLENEIADDLKRSRNLLYRCQEEYNASYKRIPSATCICNGDMDCKNVLWMNGRPAIIDLECLDYGNPLWEMFRLALSWSGDVLRNINLSLLRAFILAYRQEYGEFHADWVALYGSGLGWLEWLAYNIRRALRIECNDAEEQTLGVSQTQWTLSLIVYYQSIKEELLRGLETIPMGFQG